MNAFPNLNLRNLDCLTVRDLQVAADGERQRAADRALPNMTRQVAANRAAVLSAMARVRIYESLPPCALRDLKLPESQQELAVALQEGATGHALVVYRHEYGTPSPAIQRFTGYVAKIRRQRVR